MACLSGMRMLLSRISTASNKSCIRTFQRQCLDQNLDKTLQNQHILKIKSPSPCQQIRSLSSCSKSILYKRLSSHCNVTKRLMSEEGKAKLPPPKKKNVQSSGPISWKTVAITFGLGGGIMLWFHYAKREKELALAKERNKSVGKAAIGGEWKLVDHNGEIRTDKQYLGKWLAIYFGFTHCPDICPDEIEKMCEVVDMLGKTSGVPELVPLFITVDPERDSKEAIKKYCAEFSPKLLGMTGTAEEIDAATRAYRVYYSAGPKDEDGDYIVDHTIVMYLINPKGEFVDYYGKDKTAVQVSKSISGHMKVFSQS